jgi:hypothetical protein
MAWLWIDPPAPPCGMAVVRSPTGTTPAGVGVALGRATTVVRPGSGAGAVTVAVVVGFGLLASLR